MPKFDFNTRLDGSGPGYTLDQRNVPPPLHRHTPYDRAESWSKLEADLERHTRTNAAYQYTPISRNFRQTWDLHIASHADRLDQEMEVGEWVFIQHVDDINPHLQDVGLDRVRQFNLPLLNLLLAKEAEQRYLALTENGKKSLPDGGVVSPTIDEFHRKYQLFGWYNVDKKESNVRPNGGSTQRGYAVRGDSERRMIRIYPQTIYDGSRLYFLLKYEKLPPKTYYRLRDTQTHYPARFLIDKQIPVLQIEPLALHPHVSTNIRPHHLQCFDPVYNREDQDFTRPTLGGCIYAGTVHQGYMTGIKDSLGRRRIRENSDEGQKYLEYCKRDLPAMRSHVYYSNKLPVHVEIRTIL